MKATHSRSVIKLLFMFMALRCTEGTGQTVTLTSNLNEGNTAYDIQIVTFRCTTRGTSTILSWVSEGYIGSGGVALEFFSVHSPGRTENSATNPTTVATLISATTNSGVTEIVSELRITASVQYPNSSVGCRIDGNGASNTTIFRVIPSDVQLSSDLNEDNTAYNNQTVTFRCTTRGTNTILSWVSEDYVGTGGVALEFFSVHSPGRTEPSSKNPDTVATLINATTDDDTRVTEIVSKLRIIASIQYPTCSITCRINGNGASNTSVFRTIIYVPTASLVVETESISNDNSSNAATGSEVTTERSHKIYYYIAGGVGAGILILLLSVIMIVSCFIIKWRWLKVNNIKPVTYASQELPTKRKPSDSDTGSAISKGSDEPCLKKEIMV